MEPTLTLSRDEIARLIETGAWKRLGMSGEAMIRAYRAGQLPDPGAVSDLLVFAHLLPEKDPLFPGGAGPVSSR